MEWLVEVLTDLFRPYHHDGLPEELAFGEKEFRGAIRGQMARAARLAVDMDCAFGVFGVIGIGYARRAAWTWWPRERLMMEDVSCGFEPIIRLASDGKLVPQVHKERLACLLQRYLAYVGRPWTETQLRAAIEHFIVTCPRNDPNEPD